MNSRFWIVFFLIIFLVGCTQSVSDNSKPVLTIYAYDSFVSEYGLAPKIVPLFEQDCNCKINMLAKGDAGQMLSTLVLEKQNPKADLVIGIDNSMLSQALRADILESFTPGNINLVPEYLLFDSTHHLTPYDFGFFAFVYDSEKLNAPLTSFEDLKNSELTKKIAIQNPRTSSPGLGLLLWTIAVYGDPGYKEFWQTFKSNILTVTSGWDESAGLFSAGEVPIYLSYATSPPYYFEFEDINHYWAAQFQEGHYIQIEGLGIVKGTSKRKLAEQFIEFALTEKFQKEIPFTQFMYPANSAVDLPEAFENYAFMPEKILQLNSEQIAEKQEGWMVEWEKIMTSG
ncbi:MAG: thiamine ABC transporter substrate binding subunit [Candidatus Diapherotrites archaeon]|nr:thiamine ABC transporter substrate binding subunit [Candidatus Diapherotrites archaeon]